MPELPKLTCIRVLNRANLALNAGEETGAALLPRPVHLTTDFPAALDAERMVAILPVAAIEQHGPHLPLGVDAIINEGIVRAAMPLMPDGVLVLPTMEIGKSNQHQAFPVTLTFSAHTLIRLWPDIGESLHPPGLRTLDLLTSPTNTP